jgi:hypothetical protein
MPTRHHFDLSKERHFSFVSKDYLVSVLMERLVAFVFVYHESNDKKFKKTKVKEMCKREEGLSAS